MSHCYFPFSFRMCFPWVSPGFVSYCCCPRSLPMIVSHSRYPWFSLYCSPLLLLIVISHYCVPLLFPIIVSHFRFPFLVSTIVFHVCVPFLSPFLVTYYGLFPFWSPIIDSHGCFLCVGSCLSLLLSILDYHYCFQFLFPMPVLINFSGFPILVSQYCFPLSFPCLFLFPILYPVLVSRSSFLLLFPSCVSHYCLSFPILVACTWTP